MVLLDNDGLGQQVGFESFVSKILADSGVLVAAEWSHSFGVIKAVHVNCACVESLHEFQGSVDVGSDNASSEAVGQ